VVPLGPVAFQAIGKGLPQALKLKNPTVSAPKSLLVWANYTKHLPRRE